MYFFTLWHCACLFLITGMLNSKILCLVFTMYLLDIINQYVQHLDSFFLPHHTEWYHGVVCRVKQLQFLTLCRLQNMQQRTCLSSAGGDTEQTFLLQTEPVHETSYWEVLSTRFALHCNKPNVCCVKYLFNEPLHVCTKVKFVYMCFCIHLQDTHFFSLYFEDIWQFLRMFLSMAFMDEICLHHGFTICLIIFLFLHMTSFPSHSPHLASTYRPHSQAALQTRGGKLETHKKNSNLFS